MAINLKDNLTKSLKTGAWVTAVVLLVNFLLGLAKIEVTELFGITPATGITGTVGMKVITFLQGLVSFDVMSILYVYLSAVAIVLVGSYCMEYLPLPHGKAEWERVALVLLYGTGIFYLVLVGMKMPAIGTLVGLGVYYGAVALSLGLCKDFVKSLNLM